MLLRRDDVVIGRYALKAERLTFKTDAPLLGFDAQLSMAVARDLTVCLSTPDGLKEFVGKVESVILVEDIKPPRWAIVMNGKFAE